MKIRKVGRGHAKCRVSIHRKRSGRAYREINCEALDWLGSMSTR